jgi:hypothetical protein
MRSLENVITTDRKNRRKAVGTSGEAMGCCEYGNEPSDNKQMREKFLLI